MNLFLDTNIIIYFLAGQDQIVKLVSSATRLAASFISEIELHSYSVTEQERQSIHQFLDKIEILYADKETVIRTIKIRKSMRLKIPDAIIAAHSQQTNFIFATADKEIWDKVKDIDVINPCGNEP